MRFEKRSKLTMNPLRRTVPILAAALLSAAALAAAAQTGLRSRTFRFHYQAVVRAVPEGAKTLDLWIPYPQSDRNQTIHRVTLRSPAPVTIGREPKQGNQALYYHADNPR